MLGSEIGPLERGGASGGDPPLGSPELSDLGKDIGDAVTRQTFEITFPRRCLGMSLAAESSVPCSSELELSQDLEIQVGLVECKGLARLRGCRMWIA